MHRKLAAFLTAATLCALLSLAAAPLFGKGSPLTLPDPCAANLKRLGLAVSAYTQDYDGALPPLQTSKAASQALAPYAPNPSVFQCPVTHAPYQPNSLLSSQILAKISKPGTAELFADAVPHPDGRTTHLSADGHISHLRTKRGSR